MKIPAAARAAQADASWSRRVEDYLPFALWAYLLLAAPTTMWQVAIVLIKSADESDGFLSPPSSSPVFLAVAVVLSVVFAVLTILVAGPLAYGQWVTLHLPPLPKPRPRRVMQSSRQDMHAATHEWGSNFRFRKCGVASCPDSFEPLGDRVYHCRTLERHVPLYDHYCHWLWICVCLHTDKPYLLVLAFLPLHALFVMSVSIAAAVSEQSRGTSSLVFLVVAPVCALIALLLVINNTIPQYTDLVRLNLYGPERNRGWEWWLVRRFPQANGLLNVEFVMLEWNPYDFGTWENAHLVFGESIWTWPLWWIQSRRTKQFGRRPESDLPLGPDFRAFEARGAGIKLRDYCVNPVIVPYVRSRPPAPAGPSRRSAARSSGVELG